MSSSIDPIQIENIKQVVSLIDSQARNDSEIADLNYKIIDLTTDIEEQKRINKRNYDLVCSELYKLRIENKDLKLAQKQMEGFISISVILIILLIGPAAYLVILANV